MYRSYDYGRAEIAKATGLTGVEAEHIARKLRENNIDPQVIDWEGAISDARDYGNRYAAVQRYLLDYYGVNILSTHKNYFEQMNEEQLIDISSTKEGVKKLLNQYYISKSKSEKENIKDILLNDTQMHNVLMTALYDGAEMPLARRFLNDAMGNEVISIIPVTNKNNLNNVNKINNIPIKQKIPVISKKSWINHLENLRPKDPYAYYSKVKATAKKEARSIFTLFKESARQTFKPSQKEKTTALIKRVRQLQLQNEPLRLQLEYYNLLRQNQQLVQLQKMKRMQSGPSSTDLFAQMFGLQPLARSQSMVERPGYFIEVRPRLPPGMRWKKIPKGRMR